jgi:hypothetical protein
MTDFSKTLIRSSATGLIMTSPKDATAKKNGDLGETAKTYLINTYIKEVYGREKDITTKQMAKGTENEPEGIKMLSRFYQKPFEKNEQCFENEFQIGHPDIIHMVDDKKKVFDTKLSFDIWTFLSNVMKPVDRNYYYQIQSYLSLTGGDCGEVNFILTDCSEEMINDEKRKLMYQMKAVTDIDPEYLEAAAGLEINLIYPDIPLEQKILCFPIERDNEVIEQINKKVVKCREFLQEFEERHLKFNLK